MLMGANRWVGCISLTFRSKVERFCKGTTSPENVEMLGNRKSDRVTGTSHRIDQMSDLVRSTVIANFTFGSISIRSGCRLCPVKILLVIMLS